MIYTATITKTGQITLPKGIREILGVAPGQRVTFRREKKAVLVEREKTAQEIAKEIDALIPEDARRHHMENYAGMTSAEMQEKWSETEEARDHYSEMQRRVR